MRPPAPRPAAGRRPIARARALAAALALATGLAAAAPANACDTALLLAIDVSASVDSEEYMLQARGMAAAFRDADVIAAIENGTGVLVSALYWSGWQHQEVRLGWRRLETGADAAAFAADLGGLRRRYDHWGTSVGDALATAEVRFEDSAEAASCARRVLDVSGDGVANHGPSTAAMRDRLVARGVTVNGLVIRGELPDPEPFYRAEVIGGPGAFLEIADGYEDYARAFRRKLLRELRPLFAQDAGPR